MVMTVPRSGGIRYWATAWHGESILTALGGAANHVLRLELFGAGA